MTITKNSGRQKIVSAYVDIAVGDVGASGSDQNAIELPVGAVVVGGDLVTDTAWDSVTSDVLSVGDTTTYNRYLSASSIAATGRAALVPTGFVTTATQRYITVRWVGVGTAATHGAARLRVDYIVRKRSEFAQG